MISCSESPTDSESQESATSQYKTESDRRIINAHMHTSDLGQSDSEYLAEVLEEMECNGIEKTVLHLNEASDIDEWLRAAPGKFIAGPSFSCVPLGGGRSESCVWDAGEWPSVDWLRKQYESGVFSIMGEMMFVYTGISPSDSKMEDYWALAAELDIPVFVHINRGPPPNTPFRPSDCCPKFDSDLGNPQLFRPVLQKHPNLRIALQHAGIPVIPDLGDITYTEETFELLGEYPNVFVDMTITNSVFPKPVHEAAVRQFQQRGFLDRIMMGTDNLDAQSIIQRYESLDFLSVDEKAAILYENAARFCSWKRTSNFF